MPWLSKLAFTAIILSCLSQCMAQTSSYLLSRNQTYYNILPIFQIGDLQFFGDDYSDSVFNFGNITTYNLTSGQISTFPGDISCPTNGSMFLEGSTTVYCVTPQNVLQLDPLNSMEQIADYGAPLINSTRFYNSYGSVLFYNENKTDFDIFNTSINQFTCQFSTTEKQNIDSIFPYGEGYLVANGSNTTYYSCSGAPLIDFGDVGQIQFLLNSSSILIAVANNTVTALSANQNKTGPALLVENLGVIADSVGQVNDTHFIIATQTDDIYTLKLYTTNSDLELIQCASSIQAPIPTSDFHQFNLIPGTNSTLLDTFGLGLINLESFAISQFQGSLGQGISPPILLSNGSILEFTVDTYYIFSGDALLISGSYVSYYIDPTNADFVWILLGYNANNVLMIQISTSMPTTFPVELGDDTALTILSASYDGADEYNVTLFVNTGVYYDTAVVVFTSGIQQAVISVESSNFISATNYQEGALHYISTSSDGIIHEVYDFYNGYQIQGSTRIISGSLTNIAKINDNYVIMTTSTTSTEIFVYSISESQFVYSQSFPVQTVNQIVPLGINLATGSIAQGFAILSTNHQAYSAFDAQGNQLDSITFPSGYQAQLQALNNTSIALLVNTTLSNPYDYISVYQYTGSMETVSDSAPTPNASSKVNLSYLLLVMLIIEYLMI